MSTVIRTLIASGTMAMAVPMAFAAARPDFGPSNPFYAPSTLPFHAPPFDKIKDRDYRPAMEAGMARQRAEIEAIANNAAKPTFDNTFVALERSGLLLERAQEAFNAVSEANTNEMLQAVKAALAPELAAHNDAIYLNAKLFERVAAVYKERESLALDPESRRLIEITYDEFVRSGANLGDADKSTLKKLNEEASTLSDTFATKLLAATKEAAFHTASPAALAGLGDSPLAAAAQAAQSRKLDGYVLALQNTTQQPAFVSLEDRATRRAIYENSWGRAERGDANDTRATIARLAQLRAQRAKLLGFANHAAWKLGDQMAKTPASALEFMDVGGKPLALFYCDYFKRDNKNGGAWMSSFVNQSTLLGTLPVVYNVANLPKPAAGEPALISFDDVRTMFHEFGHALHGMFADTRYPSLSGTATARDFVEFPSQFNEHWALYPAVFDHYARHYKTGAVMPAALVEKIRKSDNVDEGYRLTEVLAAAELDMQWHMLGADAPLQNPDEFERRALERVHLDLRAVPPRYRSSYFSHIWGGGYSAGYYAYLWTQMLDDDAFQWFEDHGGLTRANGERFRRMVLSRGNTQDLAALYVAWRGKPPTIDAMMKYRGLTPPATIP